jgi:hypothetical protein
MCVLTVSVSQDAVVQTFEEGIKPKLKKKIDRRIIKAI